MENYECLRPYLDDIKHIALLTHQQEITLAEKIKHGDEKAEKRLVESNLKLAVYFAKKYQNRGLALIDLIGYANMGVMKAAKKFELEKGTRFATYARFWITQSILRAIQDYSRNIRLPAHRDVQIKKIYSVFEELFKQYNRPPTDKEIAKKTGLSEEIVTLLKESNNSYSSLDYRFEDEEDLRSKKDFIASDNPSSPETVVLRTSLRGNLERLFSEAHLSEREKDIIEKRFGLCTGESLTLNQVGLIYGVTRERIRQLESRALKKLRDSEFVDTLRCYLED